MERFGNFSLKDELNGSNIHRLSNILTLSLDIHCWFDDLKIWLEPLGVRPLFLPFIFFIHVLGLNKENRYRLRAVDPRLIRRFPEIIEFRSHHPDIPLPNPRYLALHAACSEVANLSGAGDYIEKTLRELEEIQVLSEDGSSADLLKWALMPLG